MSLTGASVSPQVKAGEKGNKAEEKVRRKGEQKRLGWW